MEISRRYKIYIAIIIAVAITLTLRWGYYHNRWRTIEMPKDGYRISYPAHWFNTTHQDYRMPSGRYISLGLTNFPFVNAIMADVYHVAPGEFPNIVNDESLIKEIIQRDDGGEISRFQRLNITLKNTKLQAVVCECIFQEYYYSKIVAFSHNNHIYAVQLLTSKKQWQKGNEIFEKILASFEFLE